MPSYSICWRELFVYACLTVRVMILSGGEAAVDCMGIGEPEETRFMNHPGRCVKLFLTLHMLSKSLS